MDKAWPLTVLKVSTFYFVYLYFFGVYSLEARLHRLKWIWSWWAFRSDGEGRDKALVGEVTKTLLCKKRVRTLPPAFIPECSLHPHWIHQEWLCHQWGHAGRDSMSWSRKSSLACWSPTGTASLQSIPSPLCCNRSKVCSFGPLRFWVTACGRVLARMLASCSEEMCLYICQPSFFPGFKAIKEKSRWSEQLRKPLEPSRGKQAMPSKLTLCQSIEKACSQKKRLPTSLAFI